jgi:hypothetical protein
MNTASSPLRDAQAPDSSQWVATPCLDNPAQNVVLLFMFTSLLRSNGQTVEAQACNIQAVSYLFVIWTFIYHA